MKIQQAYFSMEDDEGRMMTLSQPVVFLDGYNLANRLARNPPTISPLYDRCKKSGLDWAAAGGTGRLSTVINLAAFDVSRYEARVLAQAYALMLDCPGCPKSVNGKKFVGCIFWESALDLYFQETIVP